MTPDEPRGLSASKPFHETSLAKWIVRHPRSYTIYGAASVFVAGWSLFHDVRPAIIGGVTTGVLMLCLWRPDVKHPDRFRDEVLQDDE